ncbi:hypothetical protein PSACC_01804 [Paramicrosporidium saccamoebae]|uniref:AB hydrolase-1 domain-containing protein n=1 Tax=Paramicrosporidium saccamoebae TaxID=1246581 RepID=A0A2H9TKY5_9FUNG|nr:hypothetical protein PSACC_01804 [Paramicrosporidium saccamoebae]
MFLLAQQTVYWGKPKKYKDMWRERGILTTPADHETGVGKMKIYVERYANSHTTTNNLILLAGGPGQRSSVWRADLPHFTKFGWAVYLMDQRGVGRSTRLYNATDRTWRRRKVPSSAGDYTITSTAHDVALLAQSLTGKVSLLGVSYGGLLAARTVSIYPNLFAWLILDSPSMIRGRFHPSNDALFWAACSEDQHCSAKIGSVPAARRAYHRVMTGRRENQCTAKLSMDLVRPLLRGTVSDHQNGRHPSMLVVPLMLQAYKCSNPSFFKSRIITALRRITQSGRIREGRHTHQLHDFYNSWICVAEIFSYPHRPRQCRRGLHTVADQCGNWQHYYRAYEVFRRALYSPDRFLYNPIKTNRTRVVVLAGALDLVTPPPATIKWLANITARAKTLLLYNDMGHALAPTAPCLNLLFRAITLSARRYMPLLRRCLQKHNACKTGWNFDGEYSFARNWW